MTGCGEWKKTSDYRMTKTYLSIKHVTYLVLAGGACLCCSVSPHYRLGFEHATVTPVLHMLYSATQYQGGLPGTAPLRIQTAASYEQRSFHRI